MVEVALECCFAARIELSDCGWMGERENRMRFYVVLDL
jgi:hypothetical protein